MIPLHRLIVQSDSPNFIQELNPNHKLYPMIDTFFPQIAGVKYNPDMENLRYLCPDGRKEPCHIVQAIEIIAKIHQISIEDLTKILLRNVTEFYELKTDMKEPKQLTSTFAQNYRFFKND
jgi:Tat protein secretion system quality control protein TatD with DNase activity